MRGSSFLAFSGLLPRRPSNSTSHDEDERSRDTSESTTIQGYRFLSIWAHCPSYAAFPTPSTSHEEGAIPQNFSRLPELDSVDDRASSRSQANSLTVQQSLHHTQVKTRVRYTPRMPSDWMSANMESNSFGISGQRSLQYCSSIHRAPVMMGVHCIPTPARGRLY